MNIMDHVLGNQESAWPPGPAKGWGQLSACFVVVVVVVVITGEDTDKWLPGLHHVLAGV